MNASLPTATEWKTIFDIHTEAISQGGVWPSTIFVLVALAFVLGGYGEARNLPTRNAALHHFLIIGACSLMPFYIAYGLAKTGAQDKALAAQLDRQEFLTASGPVNGVITAPQYRADNTQYFFLDGVFFQLPVSEKRCHLSDGSEVRIAYLPNPDHKPDRKFDFTFVPMVLRMEVLARK